jgi:hypothetical protein
VVLYFIKSMFLCDFCQQYTKSVLGIINKVYECASTDAGESHFKFDFSALYFLHKRLFCNVKNFKERLQKACVKCLLYIVCMTFIFHFIVKKIV